MNFSIRGFRQTLIKKARESLRNVNTFFINIFCIVVDNFYFHLTCESVPRLSAPMPGTVVLLQGSKITAFVDKFQLFTFHGH